MQRTSVALATIGCSDIPTGKPACVYRRLTQRVRPISGFYASINHSLTGLGAARVTIGLRGEADDHSTKCGAPKSFNVDRDRPIRAKVSYSFGRVAGDFVWKVAFSRRQARNSLPIARAPRLQNQDGHKVPSNEIGPQRITLKFTMAKARRF